MEELVWLIDKKKHSDIDCVEEGHSIEYRYVRVYDYEA